MVISSIFIVLSARVITLEELNGYEKSIAKDFYIWQFLEQNDISKEDAEKAFAQVYRVSSKIRNAFRERGGVEQVGPSNCKILSIDAIVEDLNLSRDCIYANLNPQRLTLLDGEQHSKIIKRFVKEERNIALRSMALYYSQPIEKTLFSNPEIFLDLFISGGSEMRVHREINKKLDKNFLQKLTKYSDKFEKFVAIVLAYGDRYQPLREAFLEIETSNEMTTKTLFYLAFNIIKSGNPEKSIPFLESAKSSGYYQVYRDQASFWLYLVTKNRGYLNELLESWDINFYTVYAREELGKPIAQNVILSDDIENYKSLFTPKLNSSNPFHWLKVKDEISNLSKDENSEEKLLQFANLFKNNEHFPIYFYIAERGYKFRKQSFPTPFEDYLKDLSIEDRSLVYALARQESKFIPSEISTSYALGMMQIMPFLIKDIAKRKGEDIELEAMFNPVKNLEYSVFHIETLKKEFISPLFIAYAYNGGRGFTRRTLQAGEFSKGDFEPFLSMELLSYSETKEYGKKVLANYVVYRNILGKPVSLHQLIDEVLVPEKSDFVRK
jgi:soluble lytic murein transglycosylase